MRNPRLFAAALVFVAAGAEGGDYKVVVHSSNPSTALARDHLAAIFLGKRSQWPDGTRALPVDRSEEAPIREAFSRDVLGRSATAAKTYSLQRLFAGRGVPAPEKAAEADVLDYVRTHPGAVGYVESPTPDVKVIAVER